MRVLTIYIYKHSIKPVLADIPQQSIQYRLVRQCDVIYIMTN